MNKRSFFNGKKNRKNCARGRSKRCYERGGRKKEEKEREEKDLLRKRRERNENNKMHNVHKNFIYRKIYTYL